MFSTSSFCFGLTTQLCLEEFEYFQTPPRSHFGHMKPDTSITLPQMSSHGFVVVAPKDGDRKVLVDPKDGWINCQDLCALHLHSPSTWHPFWNQKIVGDACYRCVFFIAVVSLGSRLGHLDLARMVWPRFGRTIGGGGHLPWTQRSKLKDF